MSLSVQNVVATARVARGLNLVNLVQKLPCAEYNATRFAAVTTRLVAPKTTALFFASGKVVCTGARTVNAALLAVRKFARMVQATGVSVCLRDFRVQNIVASASCPSSVDLEAVQREHSMAASYEPELFPGLIFRPLHSTSSAVFLIFRSGRVVATGAKTTAALEVGWLGMRVTLERYLRRCGANADGSGPSNALRGATPPKVAAASHGRQEGVARTGDPTPSADSSVGPSLDASVLTQALESVDAFGAPVHRLQRLDGRRGRI